MHAVDGGSENSKERRTDGAAFDPDVSPRKISKLNNTSVSTSQNGESRLNSTPSHGESSLNGTQSHGESSQNSTQYHEESNQNRTPFHEDNVLDRCDMNGYEAAHEVWPTFFRDWPEDKIQYYFRLLRNDIFGSKCNLCTEKSFDAKHFLCTCKSSLATTRLERHDAVLGLLENMLDKAIKRGSPYFSQGTVWQVVIMYENQLYKWPEELGVSFNLYPHILAYSIPNKKLLLIEYSISWEHWITLEGNNLSDKYYPIIEQMEKAGFEVEFRVFALGSRGVYVPQLHDLLDQIFGMEHSQIHVAMEEISQTILHIPYSSYKELMGILG